MVLMAARHDILDRRESLRNPLLGSMVLHAAVFATAVVYHLLPVAQVIRWGDPYSLGGAAIAVTPVSKIPLPPRAGRVNPLANDTESQVPAPPPEKAQTREAPKEEPEAIAIQSRKTPKPAPTRRRRQQSTSRPTEDRPNQLYNPGGAAANSPMFGSTSGGGGGVGVGAGNPFGDRFGYYVELLRQRVASAWNTGQVDPRLQSAPPVIVTFDIQRDGSIRDLRFFQRSGHPTLDYSAQRAILDASPFPPLPAGFERNVARIEFWFQLNR